MTLPDRIKPGLDILIVSETFVCSFDSEIGILVLFVVARAGAERLIFLL